MSIVSRFLYYNKIKKYRSIYGYELKEPVFIVGCGHSGTSILLSILSNDKMFYSIPIESYIFCNNQIYQGRMLRLWVHNSYLEKKSCILEKTPSHCHKISRILKTFKNPKIIGIVRDGRDVSFSLKKRTGDFEGGVKRWIDDNIELIKYSKSKSFHLIKYEDFVKRPEESIIAISRFLGSNLNRKIVNNRIFPKKDFFMKYSSHEYRRNNQINQDIKDYSGQWKKGLSAQEINAYINNSEAVKLMNHFNYNI